MSIKYSIDNKRGKKKKMDACISKRSFKVRIIKKNQFENNY